MTWNAGALVCQSCGARKDAPAPTGTVTEHSLDEALANAKPRGTIGVGKKQVKCSECGATVEFPDGATATKCSFCGSPSVIPGDARSDLITPESLVPFAESKTAATEAYKKWLAKLSFRPSDLSDAAILQELRGVYVPYWTFDCKVTSRWTAESGTWIYVDKQVYKDGQYVMEKQRETQWAPANGQRSDAYDDKLVCASKGVPDDLARDLKFDTGALVPFSTQYLSGFAAESYALDLKQGWSQAQKDIATSQEARCNGDVPGNEKRNLRANHEYAPGVTFKHVLLPIWVAAFRYKDETFRFLVNGQTGEVTGKAPISWTKILLFVAAIIGAIVIIAMLLHRR
jgi:LSD1 subclass zinc finger protein